MQNHFKSTLFLSNQKFIWIGIGLGLFYWFLESSIHVFIFKHGNFSSQILYPDMHETWKRFLVITLMFVFSIYAHYSINMRRRVEDTLHEREKELTEILENNPAGIMLVSSDDRMVSWVNKNALKMIGASKKSIEGHICHKYLCPVDESNCPVLDHGKTIDQSERILLTSDSKEVPILKSVTRVKYQGKDHLLEAFFDLSDRKKMEQDLQLALAELDQIFHTASVSMRVVDSEFNILKINRTFEKMTGINEADAVGKKCHDIFSGPMCFTPKCPLTLILNGQPAINGYVDKHRPDGNSIPCILTATPFRGVDGKLIGIVESFQDITDLKQAQEGIRLERDKLNRILSFLTECVCIVNTDYIIEYQNAIFKKNMGDCEGSFCYQAFRKSDVPCETCLMFIAIESGKAQQYEFETPEGRSFEQAYAPVIDVDEKEKTVVLLRDVTEKKASMAAMMCAEQLAALGEMAAGMAHEINNPINGIINYAQILVNKSRPKSYYHDLGKRMIKESDRIARIVEGLLSFARRRKEEKTLVAVEDIISDSLSLTNAQMRKDNIVIRSKFTENLPRILAQDNEIEQVFINIISNARHALNQKYPGMDADKRLEINTELCTVDQCRYIRISFYDHGIGIPGNIIDKVRNPFYSTKSESKRTGLGLSISHGIVEDHDGHLKIKSVQGKYTMVTVELPIKTINNGLGAIHEA